MKEIMNMLMEKDLLVVMALCIIIVLFIILFVVVICMDRGKKEVIDKFNPDNPKEEEEEELEMVPIKQEVKKPVVNMVKEELPALEVPIEVQEHEEKMKEELESTATNIEDLLAQMQQSLQKEKEEEITTFEQEQEEKAIISYQELVNACKKQDLMENNIETPKTSVDSVEKKEDAVKRFKSSEFISPIYGKQKEPVYRNIVRKADNPYAPREEMPKNALETEFSMEELQREMQENEDYLEELKKFRSSL